MNQNENIIGMTLEEAGEFIEHHGILGQKWGVRRSPAQLGHASAKKQAKKEAKEAEKARKKEIKSERKPVKASKLTDAELQQRIKRLRDEDTYNNLLNNTNAVSNGKKIASDIATSTLKDLGGQTAKYYGAKLLNAGIAKIDPKLETALSSAGFDASNSGPIKPNDGNKSNKSFNVNDLNDDDIRAIRKRLDALEHSDIDGFILDMSLTEVFHLIENINK